jgi:hypothetical protein
VISSDFWSADTDSIYLTALLVVNAILAPQPSETVGFASAPASASTSSGVSSPVVTSPTARSHLQAPRRALDMLVAVLKNVDTGANYPVEIRANVCSFILQVGKNSPSASYARVKEITRPVLEDLAEVPVVDGKKGMLSVAAQKVLDSWV